MPFTSFKRAAVFTGAITTAALLSAGGAVAAQADEPITVSIRAELDLPGYGAGPAVFEVTNVVADDTVELTGANLIENPSGWRGDISVDVDPSTKSITVFSDDPGDFYTVKVVVTSAQIGAVTLVSDDLMQGAGGGEGEGEGGPAARGAEAPAPNAEQDSDASDSRVSAFAFEPAVLTYGKVGGAFVADWVVPTGVVLYPLGTAVFSFGDAVPAAAAPEIAATGLDAQTGLIIGASVLLLGGLLFVVARRRAA